jgi:hypothetical protein
VTPKKFGVSAVGTLLRRFVPTHVRRRLSPRLKARVRAWLALEPWPDLAVRHPLFRLAEYRALRGMARPFDVVKPNKPVLERGHQTSFILARWFVAAGMQSAFQVGYANGRHLFYLERLGIAVAGTDLPAERTVWVDVPAGAFEPATLGWLRRIDFFDLTATELRGVWSGAAADPVAGLLFSEATFETLLPWRVGSASVPAYLTLSPAALHTLMHETFPLKIAELAPHVRNFVFIEPEPSAGGAGAVFEACARLLPGLSASVWRFTTPFDQLFRLSPSAPTQQVVYAFTRDRAVVDALRPYAKPL